MKTMTGNPWRLRPVSILLLGASTLALAMGTVGCGGSTREPGQQSTVADLMIEAMRSAGAGSSLDEGCIRNVADKLSNESAAAVVAAEAQGESPREEPEFRSLEGDFLGCLGAG